MLTLNLALPPIRRPSRLLLHLPPNLPRRRLPLHPRYPKHVVQSHSIHPRSRTRTPASVSLGIRRRRGPNDRPSRQSLGNGVPSKLRLAVIAAIRYSVLLPSWGSAACGPEPGWRGVASGAVDLGIGRVVFAGGAV